MASLLAPLVVVTVGTDHHPFERLLGWVERWAAARHGQVRVLVQHGSTRAPAPGVDGAAFYPRAELLEVMRGAVAVVTQGGPGSVMDARDAGRRPVVVPRSAALGEHVDDHQQAFAAHLGREGVAAVALDEAALVAHLDAALADPGAYAIAAGGPVGTPPATSAAVADLVTALVERSAARRARLLWRWRHPLVVSGAGT